MHDASVDFGIVVLLCIWAVVSVTLRTLMSICVSVGYCTSHGSLLDMGIGIRTRTNHPVAANLLSDMTEVAQEHHYHVCLCLLRSYYVTTYFTPSHCQSVARHPCWNALYRTLPATSLICLKL